ncbi:MAG: hypothetical protein GY820_18560 [Gammaproteobacteria bacterium]|nr:hypothetical protein [Gammaproteobacteria bacterium]
MLDFEAAAMNAFDLVWPDGEQTGCHFILTQNIWKKVQACGLAEFYSQAPENAINIRMIAALAFVPPQEVPARFEELVQILNPWKHQQPQNIQQGLEDLFDYFEAGTDFYCSYSIHVLYAGVEYISL